MNKKIILLSLITFLLMFFTGLLYNNLTKKESYNSNGEIYHVKQESNGFNKDNKKKILVVYFSQTGEQFKVGNLTKGNTAIIAETIASYTNADLFEIKTEKNHYPQRLRKLSKITKNEQLNNARPNIINKIDNISDYEMIFLGYPIWWGDMPMPVYTFVETYNLENKRLFPFCTNEGSGILYTKNKLAKITKAKITTGFEIIGHEVQNRPKKSKLEVYNWLKNDVFKN